MIRNEKIIEALDVINKRISLKPKVAIVLGSGLGMIAEAIENPTIVPYKDIPYWPRSTAPGHAGCLVAGTLEGVPVIAMQGRVHYYEGYTMDEVTFPVRIFGELGVRVYYATNAAGGVNLGYKAGDLVNIYDHINFTGTNPLIGENESAWGPRFPDMTYAYDPQLIDTLTDVSHKEGITLHRGVYIGFSGPSYESPAEIRMSRFLGADVVGMSTVPEVIVANHMGMRVAAVSCVSNLAAGVREVKLNHQEVLDAMAAAAGSLSRLTRGFLRELGANGF